MISFQRRYQENTKLLTVCKWIADLLIVILLAYTLTLFYVTVQRFQEIPCSRR